MKNTSVKIKLWPWAIRWGLFLLLAGPLMAAIWIARTPGADQKRGRAPAFLHGLPSVANIAHRGASGSAREHSWQAYEMALTAGAQVLELDLRLLQDHTLVVAHDADLQRTHGNSTRFDELNWQQLSERLGQKTPLRLDAVLARFPVARFNLELKDESLEAAAALAKGLEKAGASDRVLVASAHHEPLVEFRRLTEGRVSTSASAREVLRFYLNYLLGNCERTPFVALQVPPVGWLGLDSAQFLRHAGSCGLVVHFWTLDREADMLRVIRAGANGVMTNFPARLSQVLARGSVAPTPNTAAIPTVLFLGDSLTAGHGLRASEALPARVQQRITASHLKLRVINAGRSGDTTAGGLSRLDWYFDAPGELAAVVIGLGSNDALRGLSLTAMEANLRKIVQRAHAHPSKPLVFLWQLQTFPNLGPEYIEEYRAVFPRVAHEERAVLIPFPLRDVAGKPGLNQADGIHPTAEGTELVANRIWEVLQTPLEGAASSESP